MKNRFGKRFIGFLIVTMILAQSLPLVEAQAASSQKSGITADTKQRIWQAESDTDSNPTQDLTQGQVKEKKETAKSLKRLAKLEAGKDYKADELLIRVDSKVEAAEIAKQYKAKVKYVSKNGFAVLTLKTKGDMLWAMTLAADAGSQYRAVFPNYLYHTTEDYESQYTPSDPNFIDQYCHTDMLNRVAWNINRGDADVLVAILDTGVDTNHPDLVGKLSPLAYNASNKQIGLSAVEDEQGHGTHVAGIIAASQDNGVGGCGTAPGVSLLPVKLSEGASGSFASDAYLDGIYYAADHGADVISMSLGRHYDGGMSLIEYDAIQYAASKGIILVAAAGNDNDDHAGFPAAYPECIAVSAMKTGNVFDSSYSNYGPEVDVAAPGTNIYSTYPDNSYISMSGTSMATPNVSGVVALIISENPALKGNEVKQILYTTAVDKGTLNRDPYYGLGAVNSYEALNLMQSSTAQITYDSQGGSAVAPVTIYSLTYLLQPEIPYKSGYTFGGWYREPEGVTSWVFESTKAGTDRTLYAKWIPESNQSVETGQELLLEQTYTAALEFPQDTDYFLFTPSVSMRYFFEYGGMVYADGAISDYATDETTLDGLMLPQMSFTDEDGFYMETAQLEAGVTYVFRVTGLGQSRGSYSMRIIKGYDVTMNLNSSETDQTFTYPVPEGATIPEFVDLSTIKTQRTNYVFGGWCKEKTGLSEWNFNNEPVSKNTTLYARWINGSSFAGGTGSTTNPYQIETKRQLSLVSYYPESNFSLNRDLTFTENDFAVTGPYYYGGEGWNPLCSLLGFYGTFAGNGHVISGLQVQAFEYEEAYAGLFAMMGSGSVVKDLGMENCNIEAESYYSAGLAGAITGGLLYGTVQNCYNTGDVSSYAPYISDAGGLIGHSAGGTISTCSNFGNVASEYSDLAGATCNAGGILGETANVKVSNCFNEGFVSSYSESTEYGDGHASAAGIIGFAYEDNLVSGVFLGYVKRSTNRGSIEAVTDSPAYAEFTSEAYAGGIVGLGYSLIDTSVNGGDVTSVTYQDYSQAGGIVGELWKGKVRNCANRGDVAAIDLSPYPDEGYVYTMAGGIAGDMLDADLEKCYNTGISEEEDTMDPSPGGVAGRADTDCSFAFCYFLDNMNEGIGCFSPGESTKLTQTQMTQAGAYQGFDFASIWQVGKNALYPYPELIGLKNLLPYSNVVLFQKSGAGTNELTGATQTGLLTKPTSPTRAGYAFGGWYKESYYMTPWNFSTDTLTGPTILYAKWIPNTYTAKFNINGGTSGTMSAQTFQYSIPEVLNDNGYKKTGYTFLGWAKTSTGAVAYKDKTSVTSLTSTNKATVNLYAKWGAPILSASSYSYNSIKISWTYAGSATSYKIYRATSAGGTYSLVYTAASTARSWVDTAQTTGKTYYYRVCPVAGGKTYMHSTYKSAKAIPSAPTVTLSNIDSSSIKVSWTGVAGATKYRIYRATSYTGDYTYLYTASSTARSWVNTGRTPGKTYYYKVRAYHTESTTVVYGSYSAVKYLQI